MRSKRHHLPHLPLMGPPIMQATPLAKRAAKEQMARLALGFREMSQAKRPERFFLCNLFLKNLQKWRFQLLAPRITPTKKGVASKHRNHPNRFVSKQKPQLLVQLPSFQEGRAPSDRARFASHLLTRRFSEPAHQPAHLICDSPKTRKNAIGVLLVTSRGFPW